jgi:murein DD-endopeptidase MepM/ murein hydrolase activator NlpD
LTIHRLRLLALGLAVQAFLIIACGSGGGSPDNDSVVIEPGDGAPSEAATPDPSVPSQMTVVPSEGSELLRGFIFPIVGACLPSGDQLMPNAPREYRKGIHEGVDLYQVDNCTQIGVGTPVQAAKAGRVIRADLSYTDLTAADLQKHSANPTTDEALDSYRGRQVWVDHGNGIVTRYAHLSGISPGITVGSQVAQGQTIAFVGESGTPESVSNPGREYHLHFELRIGPSFLGQGKTPAEVRAYYRTLFAP